MVVSLLVGFYQQENAGFPKSLCCIVFWSRLVPGLLFKQISGDFFVKFVDNAYPIIHFCLTCDQAFFFLGRLESWQTGKGVKGELPLSPSLPKGESKKDCLIFISQWMKRSKHGLFVFPPEKTLIWRRRCSIGQSCCSMTSKRSID